MALFQRDSTLAATLTNSQRAKGCVPYDPNAIAPTYGYDPLLSAGIVFTVVFFLSCTVHTVQVFRSRKWWFSVFALGAAGECIGWAGRAAAHHCPYNKTLFSLQISILIICPCFFSAGIYYILGRMINKYGRQYSLISSSMYLKIFITFDVVSIIIQAIGGGMASAAGGKDPPGNTKPGTRIMMTGIIIQLVSMCVFGLLWLTFLWRARRLRYAKSLVWATTYSAFCIIVRNFYRAIELSQGWKGYLIIHEIYFAVLDGALMAMAVVVFNVFFPARHLSAEGDGEGRTKETSMVVSTEALEGKSS
ncbi:hypothetical protein JMJ35_005895 [Cladonia borealis]|uniref:RTA1-domain-containing protein n=1 Tax=Cladonia borealis TaxID=184061 RepID=A0AA39QY10_9LECA|nr:hypothetical protein JMJ35_005895 [Cladonia borealis]